MIIEGKPVALKIRQKVKEEIETLGFKPRLAVILVGDNQASKIYVKRKQKICQDVDVLSELYEFPENVSQKEMEDFVSNLQSDGILVQLPLPKHLNKYEILNKIHPNKDVDCFNAVNIGYLSQGISKLKPCTPYGIVELLNYYNISTHGKKVTIINNSDVIGKPLSLMLQQDPYNATVTVCHHHTSDLFFHTRNSDIVITAVGKYPDFVLPLVAVNPGSVVIDAAINRINDKIFGDVLDFEGFEKKVKGISIVPGGVGVLTCACLVKNALIAAKLQRNLI